MAGKNIARWLTNTTGIVLLNTGKPTYLDTLTASAPDLTMVSEDMSDKAIWYPGDDLGSDHAALLTVVEVPGVVHPVDKKKRYIDLRPVTSEAEQMWADIVQQMGVKSSKDSNQGNRRIRTRRQTWWWTDACAVAKRARRKAWRRLRSHPTVFNLWEYKRQKALTRRIIRGEKTAQWKKTCDTLSGDTTSKQLWSIVRVLRAPGSGKSKAITLEQGGHLVTNSQEVVEILANHFVPNMQPIPTVRISGGDRLSLYESYNRDFTFEEFIKVLNGLQDRKAPGHDGISVRVLKMAGKETLLSLFTLIQKTWREGIIPVDWKRAKIVPIQKPGTEGNDPQHYRPISLLLCTSKIAERMVLGRLQKMLTDCRAWPPLQCGGRPGHSTLDHVSHIVQVIADTKKTRQALLIVFLDVKAAYDTLEHAAILKGLQEIGIKSRLFEWVKNFLQQRSAFVYLGRAQSTMKYPKKGVPQGSPLSPTLYMLATATLGRRCGEDILLHYQDDLALLIQRGRVQECVTQANATLRSLSEAMGEMGLRFNNEKCKVLVIAPGQQTQVSVKIGKYTIPTATHVKYLGV